MLCGRLPAAGVAGFCTARRRLRCAPRASSASPQLLARGAARRAASWRARVSADDRDDLDDAPWTVGTYYTKRPVHKTDSLGVIPEEDLSNLDDLPGWNAAGKMKLAIACVARELQLDAAVVEARLESLRVLVPDLASRMSTMRAGDLARLAASVSDVAQAMVRLRRVFPTANVSAMVAKRPELLLMPAQDIEARAKALRELLPGVDADAAAAEQPRLLDVQETKAALEELRRLMPGLNVVKMLANDTDLLTSVQTGPSLIPYDNGTLAQLQQTLTGGPDAAPEGW